MYTFVCQLTAESKMFHVSHISRSASGVVMIIEVFCLHHVYFIADSLGRKCTTNRDCAVTPSGQATRCFSGVCLCETGYRPTAEKRECIPEGEQQLE